MDADWREFLTDGCFYRILNVDREARQVDLLVKFEPASECLYHRHAATTTTLVLEGELVIREPEPDGAETIRIKPAGSYSIGGEGEVHIEGSNAREPTVVFFSFRTRGDVVYELLNPDLSLRRSIRLDDFQRDWQEKWP